MVFHICDVNVSFVGITDATELEAQNYVDFVLQHQTCPDTLVSISVTYCSDDTVDVDYVLQGEKFERIRRITGYLTGSLDNWNNAKQAEQNRQIAIQERR